jgi:hypothetical protein
MKIHRPATAGVAGWTVRGLAVLIGLVLPLTLTSATSAETGVVKDDTNDGGLRSMTVTRSAAGLTVVTYFTHASDRHVFRVKQPGFRKPTFVIVWRTDGPDDRFIRVATARRTPTRPPGSGLCHVRRAKWGGFDAGAASRKMEFHLAPSCLWVREPESIPRFKLDQRSFDVSDGVKTQTDALGYSRYLTTRGPGTGLN